MSSTRNNSSPQAAPLANRADAAAILAAAVGSFLLVVLSILSDASSAARSLFVFYKPTGALSGVITTAVVIWIIVWALLDRSRSNKTASLGRITLLAILLLLLSLIALFPPISDLFGWCFCFLCAWIVHGVVPIQCACRCISQPEFRAQHELQPKACLEIAGIRFW